MYMSEHEICVDYKNARFKKQQIGILADQNLCSREEIEQILEKNGCVIPKKKPKAKEPETEEEEKEKDMPDAVYKALWDRLGALDELISRANKEYREIAQFLGMKGDI